MEISMEKQEIIKTLKMDVEIPEIVQDRAEDAFDRIRAMHKGQGGERERYGKDTEVRAGGRRERQEDHAERNSEGERVGRKRGSDRKPGLFLKRAAVVLTAVTFACAGITAAASYFRWSRSMEEGMQVTEEQKIQLEEEHAVAFAMQECTKQGVSIIAEQSITDHYFSHIVFRIEGASLPDGAEPAFERINISVDGTDDFNWTAGFYDGLIVGQDGRPAYADGTPIDFESDERIEKFVRDDGSMEYAITLSCHDKGGFIDKNIHVELVNLGTVAKAEYLDTLVEDTWSFDWNLQGKDSTEIYTLQASLGDTGATVTRAELSPISIYVEYDFPMKEVTEEGINQDGEVFTARTFAEPPMLAGVKLKDGTLYPYLMEGGSMGYEEDDLGTYTVTLSTNRVIDVEQVESLLFIKSWPDGRGAFTEENLYLVPIG